MKRRDFLKMSAAGVATVVIGSRLPWLGVTNAYAAVQNLDITITDARKNMVTHNAVNTAQCYFWIYKMSADGVSIPADCPGPTICAIKGDSINVTIHNLLDEPHNFVIPGIFDSGSIPAGQTVTGLTIDLTNAPSGAHLYHDTLNAPVNRVMGLHGALVIRPSAPVGGNKYTPYDNPTTHVQDLYNDFGNPDVFPGLAWEEGDPSPWALDPTVPNCIPFRQYVWLTHQASPNLFAAVGNAAPGTGVRVPATFVNEFLNDTFSPTKNNNIPQYFTINGQSGFFSHFSPAITPMGRVGEPCVIHIMNAGLWTHSMHLHANHFYITSVNGVPAENPLWLDVYTVLPMDRIDYTIPFMRPPDLANSRGIGRPDPPLISITSGLPVYPPVEEFEVHMPALGTKATNGVELGQRMSPLCYPMHDHSEPSQTSQGGNYNMGLISGMYVTGDRNALGQGLGNFMDFPMDGDFKMMCRNIRGSSEDHGSYPAPGTEPPAP